MNKKIRAIGAGVLVALWLGLTLFAWLKPPTEASQAERRKLAQLPKLTVAALLDGSYMEKFADYGVDQFPLRDTFRSMKAIFQQKGLLQKDNNGYFVDGGYIVKQTYPLKPTSVNHAITVFEGLHKVYLEDTECRIYYSVVPDKGYYLSGYPTMDYQALEQQLEQKLPWATAIDIKETLSLSDYYRTDTHWRQECLGETASALCRGMGAEAPGQLTPVKATDRFYGVYYGHAALPMEPEEMYLLEGPMLEGVTVCDAAGNPLELYRKEKLTGSDPYEMYLSGNQPLVRIENPNATTERELVIFRDSFGSAIAPLLLQSYKTVTLLDVRYMNPELIGQFVTFDRQDVLFLYSTLILNESATLRK